MIVATRPDPTVLPPSLIKLLLITLIIMIFILSSVSYLHSILIFYLNIVEFLEPK